MESKSLNKFISESGYCSRREADQLIEAGRVVLNGAIANTGNRYVPGDVVEVDGSIIKQAKKEKLVYIALNKPVGITTTTELHVPDNIISFLNYPKRIFPVGRLDKDSEGLIFLTNDGDIVNKILRASYNHEKEYIVRVNKPCTPDFIRGMAAGVPILDTVTLPCKVTPLGRQTFKIILTQGLNRQVRRMTEHFGYKVTMLQRVRILHVKLDKLAAGKWRYLNEAEVEELKYLVEADGSEAQLKKGGSGVRQAKGGTRAGQAKARTGGEETRSSKESGKVRSSSGKGKTKPERAAKPGRSLDVKAKQRQEGNKKETATKKKTVRASDLKYKTKAPKVARGGNSNKATGTATSSASSYKAFKNRPKATAKSKKRP